MIETNTLLFFALVVFGAVVQTVTGFALGLIIIAGVTVLGIAEISFSAAVISMIALANVLVALRASRHHIDLEYVKWVSVGLVPAMLIGVILLEFLSTQYYDFLQVLLGVVIICAGVMLMITPAAFEKKSPKPVRALCGMLGGVMAGLYSAGGPPLAYFMYRQPIELNAIRATLLATFAISTLWRTLVVAVAGHIDSRVLITAATSIPIVIVATLVTGRFMHHIPDLFVRRLVFVLLIGAGAFLVVR
ncbi:MAG: hypothetical protein CMQ20_03075 [Gammaproteobacteria bacterium]|jgi:uncharacterized membrane protein YfcA|nr:hypothetical protein [Gammaproteobacteria bacterium]|tara:strand:+ start:752 stop:1492 length:741 start_codon:yes stop_codon:yes gene_type:complete